MKALNNYIVERLHINKDSKVIVYKYFPKTYDELKEILENLVEEDVNANLNNIDVSKIVDMGFLFENLDPHNIDISNWDVSNVENMNGMFFNCYKFNSDLSNWDVSNVKNMDYMFNDCRSFTGEGLENWKPIKCTNMFDVFSGCKSLKNRPSWYKNFYNKN